MLALAVPAESASDDSCKCPSEAPPVTVKVAALVAVPPAVTTVKVPEVAPAGSRLVIWLTLTTLKEAGVPLSLTEVAPLKLLPVSVTVMPAAPLPGLKLLITGAGMTVNKVELTAVPAGVMTTSLPVGAAVGTTVRISVAERMM